MLHNEADKNWKKRFGLNLKSLQQFTYKQFSLLTKIDYFTIDLWNILKYTENILKQDSITQKYI